MQKTLYIFIASLILFGCSEESSLNPAPVETEEQEEKANQLNGIFANGNVLAVSSEGERIVTGKQGKLWARSSDLSQAEKDEEKVLVKSFNPSSLVVSEENFEQYSIYLSLDSDAKVALNQNKNGTWMGQLNDKSWKLKVTCLPLVESTKCNPSESAIIEIVSNEKKWSTGKPAAVGFLYGQSNGAVTFSGNLDAQFSDYDSATLKSVVVLNPVDKGSFLSLKIHGEKEDLLFWAENNGTVGRMKWSMNNSKDSSPLKGFLFLGGSNALEEGFHGSEIILPIYNGALDMATPDFPKGKVQITIDRNLVSPNQ